MDLRTILLCAVAAVSFLSALILWLANREHYVSTTGKLWDDQCPYKIEPRTKL